jgi:hypothetical protein
MRLNFREWLDYQPPAPWANQAMDFALGGIGAGLGHAINRAADQTGNVQSSGGYSGFSTTNSAWSRELSREDREFLRTYHPDTLHERPRYFLLRTAMKGNQQGEVAAMKKLLTLPAVKRAIANREIDLRQARVHMMGRGIDPVDGQVTVNYGFKIEKTY